MMRGLLLSMLVMLFIFSRAQNKISRARAFYTISLPGMQMVDENGNKVNPQPTINRFILLECTFYGKPVIDSVWINNTAYAAALADTEERNSIVGVDAAKGKPVVSNIKKGHHAWKIFITNSTTTVEHAAMKTIRLKGRLGSSPFRVSLYNEIQLTVPDSY